MNRYLTSGEATYREYGHVDLLEMRRLYRGSNPEDRARSLRMSREYEARQAALRAESALQAAAIGT
jgi:hypothetical protein